MNSIILALCGVTPDQVSEAVKVIDYVAQLPSHIKVPLVNTILDTLSEKELDHLNKLLD